MPHENKTPILSANQDAPDQWADFNALRASTLAGELPLPPMAAKLVDADGQLFELWTKYQSLRAEMAAAAAEIDTIREQNPDVKDFPSVRILQKQLLDENGEVVRSISMTACDPIEMHKALMNEAGLRDLLGKRDAEYLAWRDARTDELEAKLDVYEVAAREAGLLAACDRRAELEDLADEVALEIAEAPADTAWGALIQLRVGAAAIDGEPESIIDEILARVAVWDEDKIGAME
jgi:hypothetical protein